MNRRKSTYLYTAINVAVLGVLLYFFKFNLPSLLGAPFEYHGDSLDMLRRFKMLLTGEWSALSVPVSKDLGAPFGFNGGDFPQPIAAQLLLQKIITTISGDIFLGFNLYVTISFFLSACGMCFALRKLGVIPSVCLAISVLYTFIPFHYLRISHTNYIQYFYLPIVIYIITRIWDEAPPFIKKRGNSLTLDLSSKSMLMLFFVLVFSSWNFYYSFFIAALIIAATLSAWWNSKNKFHIISGSILLLASILPTAVGLVPYIKYKHDFGQNNVVANRAPQESEIYGLKIAEMVLPVPGHRIESLSKLRNSYDSTSPLSNEGVTASIGIVGTAGFLLLILLLATSKDFSGNLKRLSVLNITCILLATIGGAGSILAYVFSTQLRGYNRISIFIATVSLMAIAIALSHAARHFNLHRYAVHCIAATILFVGLFDQIPAHYALTPNTDDKARFDSDVIFFSSISKALNKNSNAQIFQLPYMHYPESQTVVNMPDYMHLTGYLHSERISWSYGAVRGREGDAWYKRVSSLPARNLLIALENSGFSGIYIDRRGYEDRAISLQAAISTQLNQPPIESPDGTKIFYKLSPVSNNPEQYKEVLDTGFYNWEGNPGSFAWSKGTSRLSFQGEEKRPTKYKVEFKLNTLTPRSVTILFDNQERILNIRPGSPTTVELQIETEQGKIEINFKTDEPPTQPGVDDKRFLAFGIRDLRISEEGSSENLIDKQNKFFEEN
ncbi:hypothetical protein SA496_24510 [Pseudomonas sp. JS3066]|uniref:hypothetical protein n=1 Tax=Pseudomonas sp. JS3066 TaxID=3090665 RepID=UPI002E7AC262|nr:hypothetical protein [Pseudomonas sp. JS3066]WVK92836.1 hypothetical protein SA496_24510 [Pseudomonas sp. JS3066]